MDIHGSYSIRILEPGIMQWISVKDLQSGMVVDRDVTNSSGQCLVARGVKLDSKLIAILADRGITSVEILGDNPPKPETSDEQRRQLEEEAANWLAPRYLLSRQNPLMMELYPLFLRWLAEKGIPK